MSAPTSIVEQHLKTLTDKSMSEKSKLEYAKEVATILNKGDTNKKAINDEDRKNMYVWFKIGMEIPLAPKPSMYKIIENVLWNLHKNALSDKDLTPAKCQKNYIDFILNILRNEHLNDLVTKIFDEDQKKKVGAATGAAQPKRSMFSFGSKKPKPADTKAAAEVTQKPVVFSTSGSSSAAIHTAPVTPAPVTPITPTPVPLVAANKSISDPTVVTIKNSFDGSALK